MATAVSSELPKRCWAEIDLGALTHNARVAAQAADGGAVMGVVKSDGYGHGMVAVGAALEAHVDAFGVASVDEGVRLRAVGCRKPIVLLGAVVPDQFPWVIDYALQASLSTIAEAGALDALAREAGKVAQVHVVFDTGMGRIGFGERDDVRQLMEFSDLEVVGLASHYPSADEDEEFTRGQLGRFVGLVEGARLAGLAPRWVHIANSAGVLGFPSEVTNMVRAGLMLYGSSPLAEHQEILRPALEWKSRIALLRDLPPGQGISYGRTFLTEREPFTRVATVGVGYGDGYPRALSGRGAEVIIRGQRCPLLGRVTMDQIMVDVTGLGDVVCTGDEVVLIGSGGRETVLAAELAKKASTIAWEIFTGITQRVPRVYIH